jgi:nucleotide-binding universal stress UspA family protein
VGTRTEIVVALDGSEHADRALRWAADQALLEGRPLRVLAVGADAARLADAGAELAVLIHPDLQAHPDAREGDPRTVLIELSATSHMIVMGSHGRGMVPRLLLGSVSSAVSRHATCPVIVCRPQERAGDGVVVGVDGTPECLPMVAFAYRQAALRGQPLTVLHTYWDARAALAEYRRSMGRDTEDPDLADLEVTLATSVAGFGERYPDVHPTLELHHGLVDQALLALQRRWDLVVVGHRSRSMWAALLSESVASAVLDRAATTVAVIPEADPPP